MAEQILIEAVGSFGGRFPDIPVSETVQTGIVNEMADSDPMYVTLPIGKVNAESRNGRKYPQAAYEAMVKTINTQHPVGQLGHLRESDRSYVFNVPPLVWMGAMIESDGTVWGKAYVMPHATDVRNYIKSAKITKSSIGTSLYGLGDVGNDGTVSNLQIESIDLVHPQRVGVPAAAATPVITKETVDPGAVDPTQTHPISKIKETPMSEEKDTKAAEPINESAVLTEQKKQVRELTAKVDDLTAKTADYEQLVTEMGKPSDPIIAYRQMVALLNSLKDENAKLLEETISDKVKAAVKMETARPIIVQTIKTRKPTTKTQVEHFLAETLADEGIKALLSTQRVEESGEAHKRPTVAETKTDKSDPLFYAY